MGSLSLRLSAIHNLLDLTRLKVILVRMDDFGTCDYCGDPDCIGTCQPSAGGFVALVGVAGVSLVGFVLLLRWILGIG